jgi:hypothetical protein
MPLPEDRPQDWAFALQWMYEEMSRCVPGGLTLTSARLYHAFVDRPLDQYLEYRKARQAYKDRVTTTTPASTSEASGEVPGSAMSAPVRPPPPSFGPLVRLYILADKYDLPHALKLDICRRVEEVGRLGRCIPATWDVWNLWENVIEAPYGEDTAVEHALQQDNLKETILDMYRDLNMSSFRNLFFQSQAKEATANDDLTGNDNDAQNNTKQTKTQQGALGIGKTCTDDEVCDSWHPVFMRDLMAKMHRKLNDLKDGVPNVKKCAPADGRGRRGRLRGCSIRERFYSLYANSTYVGGYGESNWSGEELAGGGDATSRKINDQRGLM